MGIAIRRRLQAKERHSHCLYSLRRECGKISSIWDYKKPHQVSKSVPSIPRVLVKVMTGVNSDIETFYAPRASMLEVIKES